MNTIEKSISNIYILINVTVSIAIGEKPYRITGRNVASLFFINSLDRRYKKTNDKTKNKVFILIPNHLLKRSGKKNKRNVKTNNIAVDEHRLSY